MNSDDLRQLIKQYKKPGARKPARKPTMRQAPVTNKPRMLQKPAPTPRQPVAITDRPLAAHGLTSYRYKGRFGWIMIGAKDHEGALNEARRSTDNVVVKNLQIWDGESYVPVTNARNQRSQKSAPAPARLDTKDMQWDTVPLRLGERGELHNYTGLRIVDEPFIAIREDGPQGTSNRFYIHDIHSGRETSFVRGNRTDIYRSLKRALNESLATAERERQAAIHHSKKEREKEQERLADHFNNHGPGFYITPFYSIPEIAGDNEPIDADGLYGDAEGDCLGPFPRDIQNLPGTRQSNAVDMYGGETLEDVENLYWDFFKRLPPNHQPFMLIEAQSRKDALAGRGHVWIVDGLEKGPPVDPRQTGFAWSK
jgi:hypothetical protein